MNLWPFPHMPSFEHICQKCGYHMLKPLDGEPYCATEGCENKKVPASESNVVD